MFKLVAAAVALSHSLLAADLAPTLEWVKFAGNSPLNTVNAAVADAQGNLYIAGTTRAVDLAAVTPSLPQRDSPDAFVLKLNPNGDIVYATYFGGSGNDNALSIALGPGGSVLVAGWTNSTDLPATPGAYLTVRPPNNYQSVGFVLKLDASGTKEWATYFPENIHAIAADAGGNPFIGGSTGGYGGLPITPGAYNSDFKQTFTSGGFITIPGPTSAFVTKLNASGTALVYSTYVPRDHRQAVVQSVGALAIDAAGNALIGVGVNSTIALVDDTPSVVKLNSTGSAVLASTPTVGRADVAAIALDRDSNVYVSGVSYAVLTGAFPATPGAFQSFTPHVPRSGGGADAFVAKFDADLTQIVAATLLGGGAQDQATSVAVDDAGNIFVGGYTASKDFPTRSPFQTSFSTRSGFAAAFDPNLSNLLFSTYLGDTRPFETKAVIPDASGNVLIAGSTVTLRTAEAGDFLPANFVVANKIKLAQTLTPRLDSVVNYVSRLANPLAPGEPIIVTGDGFSPEARVLLNGAALTTVNGNASFLVAVIPSSAATAGVHTVQVSNNTLLSNPVYVPAAPSSPAIYTQSGASWGDAYVLNADGTLNTPENPAAPGSAITIYAVGAGRYTRVGPYAVTEQMPAVFIEAFYCNGIAATMEPVPGLPGEVFKLSVTVPSYADIVRANPDLTNFRYPPQSLLRLIMGGGSSQQGVFLNIK